MNRIFFYVSFFVLSFSTLMHTIGLITNVSYDRPSAVVIIIFNIAVLSLMSYVKDKDGLY